MHQVASIFREYINNINLREKIRIYSTNGTKSCTLMAMIVGWLMLSLQTFRKKCIIRI